MIAGPLLLLVLPVAMAVIVYILLRWRSLSSLLASATALLLGVAIIRLPFDQASRFWGERQISMGETVNILGRELVLEPTDRLEMALLFFSAAAIFLLAWRFASHSLLLPLGLGLLSLLSGALLIRPLIYATLLIEIAFVVSVFALQIEGRAPTRGGLHYLTFSILALPGLLVTHWLLERYALTPNETFLLTMATALLTISFALLLGVAPFHTWVSVMTGDSVPLAGVFVLTVDNGAVWFLLLDFLDIYPWLSGHPMFSSIVLTAGIAMAIVGGLLAAAQTRLGPLIGYAALIDTGAALIALSMSSRLGMALVFLSLLVRPFGLILMAAGLSGLRARNGNDSFAALQGEGWRSPWSSAALFFGAISAGGLPVSAGFAWRWALYRGLAPAELGAVLALLLSSAGVMAGLWRGLVPLLTRPRGSDATNHVGKAKPEGWLTATIVVGAILCTVGVGLFPQSIAPLAIRLAEGYAFFVP